MPGLALVLEQGSHRVGASDDMAWGVSSRTKLVLWLAHSEGGIPERHFRGESWEFPRKGATETLAYDGLKMAPPRACGRLASVCLVAALLVLPACGADPAASRNVQLPAGTPC